MTAARSRGPAIHRTGSTAARSSSTLAASPAATAAGSRGPGPSRSTAAETLDESSYPGGKSGAGVWQRIISMIPPHEVLVVPFAGRCGVTRRIRPAAHTIIIDRDPEVCDWWHRWQTSPSGRAVEIHCTDGIDWLRHRYGITRYRPPGDYHTAQAMRPIASTPTLIFCDPPYVLAERTGRIYRHELTDDQHATLVGTVSRIDAAAACVILCGYWSPIYRTLAHWRRIEHQVMTRGGLRREQLWLNYAPPLALHDTRHIGRDRRERERIHRRQKTVLQSLAAMPPIERAAMLDAIRDQYAGGP